MEQGALLLTEGRYHTSDAKTAHGLVRGPSRWKILGLVDEHSAGAEAGTLLDGKDRGIPIFATLEEALQRLPQRPEWCVVGVATHGGRFPPSLRANLHAAARAGLGIVNGLHELAGDDPEITAHAPAIHDVRRPRPVRELAFWHGEAHKLAIPRVAVIGTDCALGKRTTTQLLVAECRRRGIPAEMIYTGQTGWMQGGRYGFVLDSTPNDFVPGELERAVVQCAREAEPRVIFLEGQSALRNPSGPCGAELIVSVGARQVVLQHAPGRTHYDGAEELGIAIPSVPEEIELLRFYRTEVAAVTINTEGLTIRAAQDFARELERTIGRPVVLPLTEGVGRVVDALRL